MTWDGVAIVFATIVTPLAAVAISIWYQERKQKQDAKYNLFASAMKSRKAFPPTVEWVNALNLIDVVFHNSPKVITAWHVLFEYYHVKPMDDALFRQKTTELLSEMAADIGYPSLKQTDIDKFYHPEAHEAQGAMNHDLQVEFLRVLKSSKSF